MTTDAGKALIEAELLERIHVGLERNANRSAYLDSGINGTMDAELEGVSDFDERVRIVESHRFETNCFTGQRMILDLLRDDAMLFGTEPWFTESERWYHQEFLVAQREHRHPIPPSMWAQREAVDRLEDVL